MSEEEMFNQSTEQGFRLLVEGAGKGPGWGTPISETRKRELEDLLNSTPDEVSDGVFSFVTLSGSDVYWLAVQSLVRPFRDLKAAQANLQRASDDSTFRFGFLLWGLKLAGADLRGANLRGAMLRGADLTGAVLSLAYLQNANLSDTNMFRAMLTDAHLEQVDLSGANLAEALMDEVHLEGANLALARLERTAGRAVYLEGANLHGAHLERADFNGVHLEGADLSDAHLEGANLAYAHLEGSNLEKAHLEGTNLERAYLESKVFSTDDPAWQRIRLWVPDFPTDLPSANLRGASFDKASRLNDSALNGVRLDQVIFDNTNLTVVYDTPQKLDRPIR